MNTQIDRWNGPLVQFTMIWLLVVLFFAGAEASLLPRIRKMSTSSNTSFREVKELLTRYAYTSKMEPLLAKDLIEEYGFKIVESRKQGEFTDPLLMIAVNYNNPTFVRNWIQAGLPVYECSHDYRNAWHCYRFVNPEIRDMLKAAAVPQNMIESRFNSTPLWFLLRTNHQAAVKDLIESQTFTEKDLPGGQQEFDKILKALYNGREPEFVDRIPIVHSDTYINF